MSRIIATFKRALPRGSFVRNAGLIAGGTALGQGIAILASPLLTRLYTPEDFGVLAVFASLLGIGSVVASLRYEQAIPLPSQDQEAAGVFLLAIYLAALMGVLVCLGVWFFPAEISSLFDAQQLRPYLWLLPIGIFTTGAYQALSSWAVRQRAFPRLARTKLNQGIGATGTQVLGGLLHFGPIGLIAGQFVGQTAGTFTLARHIWPHIRRVTEPLSSAYRGAKRYRQFLVLGTPSALMNSAAMQLPGLLLASFYGVEFAGLYLLSRRVLGAPLDLIGRSVGQVYFGEAALLARTSVSQMQELFLKTTRRLLFLALFPVVVLALFSPTLFSLMFGNSWNQAGVFAQLLSIMFLGQFVVAPVSQTFVILEKQKYSLILNALKTITAVAAFWVPYTLGLSATGAVLSYSLGMLVYYSLVLALSLHLMRRLRRLERVAGTT